MIKIVPLFNSLLTSIDPPCASTNPFAMDNPRPVPLSVRDLEGSLL